MAKRIHVALGVPDLDALNEALRYYTLLFGQAPDETGQVFLGTGREVTGAYWTTDVCYLYVFIGQEFGQTGGLDHLGIQFDDEDEMNDTRRRVSSDRWSEDPSGITWELFPEVPDE